MSGHEVDLSFQFLYATLAGDATLTGYAPGGVFRSLAAPLTATPYVIMAFMGGSDVTTMNGFRLMDSLVFQVKAVGPANATAAVSQAALRIDQLLGLTAGTVSGGYIGSCYRESPFQMDELVDGELWTNFGGLYRIQIEQAP